MICHRRKPCQDIFDVGVGIDAATAATRDDLVDHCAPPSSIFRSDEEPVLLPDRRGTDRVFTQVIVDLNSSVFYERNEHRPLPKGVMDRFAHEAPGQMATTFFKVKKDAVDSIEDGTASALPEYYS